MIYRLGLNKFKFHYKKLRDQMIVWTLITDFIYHPEKYDWQQILKDESTEIQNK